MLVAMVGVGGFRCGMSKWKMKWTHTVCNIRPLGELFLISPPPPETRGGQTTQPEHCTIHTRPADRPTTLSQSPHQRAHSLSLHVGHSISFKFRVTSRTVYTSARRKNRIAHSPGMCRLVWPPIVLPSSRICKTFCHSSVDYLLATARNALKSNPVGTYVDCKPGCQKLERVSCVFLL